MRIISERTDARATHLCPGDSVCLVVADPLTGRKQIKLRETVTKSMAVDYYAIFELDDKERKKLGLKDAVGGIFGERA